MWQYSHFLSTFSCRQSTCGSSTFKDSFPSSGEVSVTSTRSSVLGEAVGTQREITYPSYFSPLSPPGGVDRDLPSLRMRPEGISGSFRDSYVLINVMPWRWQSIQDKCLRSLTLFYFFCGSRRGLGLNREGIDHERRQKMKQRDGKTDSNISQPTSIPQCRTVTRIIIRHSSLNL